MLTNEQKIEVVLSHIKNVQRNCYKLGNSIYVSRMNDRVTVSAFKVSRSCFSTEIENEIQIGIMSDELIKILKITAL